MPLLMPALSLVAALVVEPGPDTASVLASLARAGRQLKTMQADFVETKVLVLLDERQQTRGRVLLQVPGRLRWDYTAPQQSVTLVKDGEFARYVPQTKQVFRGSAGGEADLLVGFGPGAADLGRKYEVTLVGDEHVDAVATHVLELKPRPDEGRAGLFDSIRLWVDKARFIPVQTRLTEPTGDHTTIRFENVTLSRPLPGDAFELKLPAGVVEVR